LENIISDIKLYLDYKDLSWIVTIEDYCYDEEYGEIYPEFGTVELDGGESYMVDITSEDKKVLQQMKDDNKSLFEEICEIYEFEIFDAIIKKELEWQNNY